MRCDRKQTNSTTETGMPTVTEKSVGSPTSGFDSEARQTNKRANKLNKHAPNLPTATIPPFRIPPAVSPTVLHDQRWKKTTQAGVRTKHVEQDIIYNSTNIPDIPVHPRAIDCWHAKRYPNNTTNTTAAHQGRIHTVSADYISINIKKG